VSFEKIQKEIFLGLMGSFAVFQIFSGTGLFSGWKPYSTLFDLTKLHIFFRMKVYFKTRLYNL